MKRCSRCGQTLLAEAFYPDPSRRLGLSSYCRDCNRETKRIRYLEQREDVLARRKLYDQDHGAARRSYNHAYYETHRQESIDRMAAWQRAHPDRCVARQRNRRNRVRSNTPPALSDVTPVSWQNLIDAFGGRCFYCGGEGRLEMDHVIPVSRGGRHVLANLVPACGTCNKRKHNAQPLAFLVRQVRLA